MMKSEFENLAGRAVTNEQYRAIETLYMSSNLEKTEFVKSIRTMLKSMNNLYESGLTAKATLEYTGELNEKAKEALHMACESDFVRGFFDDGRRGT